MWHSIRLIYKLKTPDMRLYFMCLFLLPAIWLSAQEDSITVVEEKAEETPATRIFHSQKLINSKTAEVLGRGVLEFSVAHNFGDIAGSAGGIQRFFGLDNATDIRIGFQVGLSNKVNLIAARAKGAGAVQQQWELGIKWQLMRQQENDPKNPLSLTLFANDVVASQKRAPIDDFESSFDNFGDRHSQVIQLMIARKMGKIGLQLSPLYLHTNYVVPGDDASIFALGGGLRLPLSRKIVILADYFHPFRSDSSRRFFKSQGMKFYDPLGVGIEILTEGHIFHLNFTNATEILENRFIRRTLTSWGKGQYRWAFSISRNFVLRKKRGE